MPKNKTPHLSRPEAEENFFDEILSEGAWQPATTYPSITDCRQANMYCYHCDHRGRPEPGTYRFSVERREKAVSATLPIGIRGEKPLNEVLRSPTLMGYGKGGEIWICVTCYEGILDGRLYRKLFGDGEEPTGLHPLIQWLNFIIPETRSLSRFSGMFTLTSPQRHTVYLWAAVHRRLVYLCENPDVKSLLDNGVYVEKAFPSDVFPALNGDEVLYIDEQTRCFKGYSPNGKQAELRWGQVLNTRLSDSLAMSDELVEYLESEAVDVSSDESKFEQEGSRQRDSDGDERQTDSFDGEEEEQEEGHDRSTEDKVSDSAGTKHLITAETNSTTPSAALEPSTRGRKRDWEGEPIVEPVVSSTANTEIDSSTEDDGETQSTDSEGEGARRKRAKLAWKWYLKSYYCS